MKHTSGRNYRIVLRGELGDQYRERFGGMTLERQSGMTVLTGKVIDQAQLLGFVERGQELGIELVSVEPVDDDSEDDRDHDV
jgi:hypothetical protein